MNFKNFSLFSCLLVYAIVILFTLGGSRIGEAHNKHKLKDLAVIGNTYAYGYPTDDVYHSVSIGGWGTGRAPKTVDGNRATAFYSFSLRLTVREKPKNVVEIIQDGSHVEIYDEVGCYNLAVYASGNDEEDDIFEDFKLPEVIAGVELSLYGTLSYSDGFTIWKYYIHHHVLNSSYPPGGATIDSSTNVGAQSDPH